MSNKKLKQVKEFNGMMTCILEHEITKTTAEYEWTGPKMDPEMWRQVLAFFRWTYRTTKSESQVRLFVNHQTRQWAAWAFPQRMNTNMRAHEITEGEVGYELTKEQRAQFGDQDGWFYYGTVHHHCMAGAFQSGTDTANEFNQDGLHITVGHMDKTQYDIDARLYQSGYKLLALDLRQFWDVGDPLSGIPNEVRKLLPEDALKTFVKLQMGTPPPDDQVFPEVWKTNLILPPPVIVRHESYSPQNFHGTGGYYRGSYTSRSRNDLEWDTKRAVEELMKYLDQTNPIITLTDAIDMLEEIEKGWDNEYLDLIDIVTAKDCKLATLIKAAKERHEFMKNYQKAREERKVVKQLGNGTTMEDVISERREDLQKELADAMNDGMGGHHPGYGAGFGLGG